MTKDHAFRFWLGEAPPRPTEVHDAPCANCPSAHYDADPEALDVEDWVRRGACTVEQASFPCAWRPWRICRGVYDRLVKAAADGQ